MKKYVNLLNAILGAILLIAVKYISPVCTGKVLLQSGKEMPMRCHYTSTAVILIAIILIALSIELYIRKAHPPITFIVLGLILFIIPLDTPFSIGVCMKPMECHSTALWIKIISGILILSGISTFFLKDENSKIV